MVTAGEGVPLVFWCGVDVEEGWRMALRAI